MATTKRKLPVLQSGGEPEEARPPWHWVGFGTVMIFTAWLPLAYLGAALVAPSAARPEPATEGTTLARALAATLVPLVIAAVAGGFLVGRFGKPAGVREALLAGLVTGLAAVVLTALSGPFSPLFLLVVAIAAGAAGLGGKVGVRGRPF
jgi:hypothetical protein